MTAGNIDKIKQIFMEVFSISEAEVKSYRKLNPVKIYDLASRIVELSDLSVEGDDFPSGYIAIKVIGLRPGKKLYEKLMIGNNL